MSGGRTAADCPHEIDALLQAERQYMPNMGTRKGGLVWCDDCKGWVHFDWVERDDGKGMSVTGPGR